MAWCQFSSACPLRRLGHLLGLVTDDGLVPSWHLIVLGNVMVPR